jgi:hypothetical protein
MTVIAVACGVVMKRARDQRLAVAAILEAGSQVIYDFEPNTEEQEHRQLERMKAAMMGKPAPVYSDAPWLPRWLRNFIGVDAFHRVQQVDLLGPRATDSTMEHVKRLSGVKRLALYNTSVTDAGLANIDTFADLEFFRIEKGLMSDAGLEHLGRLRNLQHLGFTKVDITNDGLRHLEGLRKLDYMHFQDTRVTADAVEELRKKLPNCRPVAVYP